MYQDEGSTSNKSKINLGCALFALIVIICMACSVYALKFLRDRTYVHLDSALCVNNLNDISKAAQLYVNDNNFSLPNASNWMDAINGYLKPYGRFMQEQQIVFRCPTIMEDNPKCYGYAMNSTLSHFNSKTFIGNKGLTIIFYDSTNISEKNASDPLTSLPTKPRHITRSGVSSNMAVTLDGQTVMVIDGVITHFPLSQPAQVNQ